jgi:hypothetical protein
MEVRTMAPWVKRCKPLTVLLVLLVAGLVAGCNRYYTYQVLNFVSIGDSKEHILKYLPTERDVVGMQMRAARRTTGGKLLEVGEVPLITPGYRDAVPYWFLFEDGRLVQWGRPEDWRNSSARYEINFNPSPGVPR